MAMLVLVRHGQTSWSASGKHTSYTDVDLTPDGEREALAIAVSLRGWRFTTVLTSPRRRAMRTAELAGVAPTHARAAVDDDLTEWNYGTYEGVTTAQIRVDRPEWILWRDGCPGGEAPVDVQRRADRVLARVRALLDNGNVALVGHGHFSRALAARWIGLAIGDGALLGLDTATVSVLGQEREQSVIWHWNLPAGAELPTDRR